MFQDDALFPHRDVAANIAFGLRMQGVGKAQARARVEELLGLVGLPGRERRSVASLSGGEQKRVALARALAPGPRVLLLDEPLGALDRPLHDRLVTDLGELFATIGQTALYVTHDVGRGVRARGEGGGHARGPDRPGRDAGGALGTPGRRVGRPVRRAHERRRGRCRRDRRPPRGCHLPPRPRRRRDRRRQPPRRAARHALGAFDDGREIVSAETGLEPPAPGTRVAVEIDPAAVVEIPALPRARRPRLVVVVVVVVVQGVEIEIIEVELVVLFFQFELRLLVVPALAHDRLPFVFDVSRRGRGTPRTLQRPSARWRSGHRPP